MRLDEAMSQWTTGRDGLSRLAEGFTTLAADLDRAVEEGRLADVKSILARMRTWQGGLETVLIAAESKASQMALTESGDVFDLSLSPSLR